MKTYAAKRQDGSIYVINCKDSPENFLQDMENDIILHEVTENQPLPDANYKAQWKDVDGVVTLEEADKNAQDRDVKLALLRDLREPKLDAVDKKINILVDAGADATAWRAHRQALRDITEEHHYANDKDKGKATLDAFADDLSDFVWPDEPEA